LISSGFIFLFSLFAAWAIASGEVGGGSRASWFLVLGLWAWSGWLFNNAKKSYREMIKA